MLFKFRSSTWVAALAASLLMSVGASAGEPASGIPDMPAPVTSFGGAVVDGYLYVYGGHSGGVHSYCQEDQEDTLRRVSLRGGEWEILSEGGPRLQGLAMVAHGNKLYRIGGFTAQNKADEESSLWSQAGVASFDLKTREWTSLPDLPETRSSFDAVVLNDTIYVLGGWWIKGDAWNSEGAGNGWHQTAWKMNLKTQPLQWEAIADAPFERRALSAAVHNGKIYVIGGMQKKGGPTNRVGIYDPATNEWSEGPALIPTPKKEGSGETVAALQGAEGAKANQPRAADADTGKKESKRQWRRGQSQGGQWSTGMVGFGNSAFAVGGALYVSAIDGTLQRLSDDGSRWEVIAQTPTARIFHRLLPVDDSHLLVVGGVNTKIGKFKEVELLTVSRGN